MSRNPGKARAPAPVERERLRETLVCAPPWLPKNLHPIRTGPASRRQRPKGDSQQKRRPILRPLLWSDPLMAQWICLMLGSVMVMRTPWVENPCPSGREQTTQTETTCPPWPYCVLPYRPGKTAMPGKHGYRHDQLPFRSSKGCGPKAPASFFPAAASNRISLRPRQPFARLPLHGPA